MVKANRPAARGVTNRTARTGHLHTSLSVEDFHYLRTLVHGHTACLIGKEKAYLIEARLEPVAKSHGLSVREFVTRLEDEPLSRLHREAIEALMNNETAFFRDPGTFATLQEHVLPSLIRRRRSVGRLDIWCAGCASGQEPYSVAMVIREHFPFLLDWSLRLIASDWSVRNLERAREGLYGRAEIERGLPAGLRTKYFQKDGRSWRIDDTLRGMVEFQHINLVDPMLPVPDTDIIFLRNVLIYFARFSKRSILTRVCEVLRPDGYLTLGAAETTLDVCPRLAPAGFQMGGSWYRVVPEEGFLHEKASVSP
jgi:chemotaxis protein methyltransferase CheR